MPDTNLNPINQATLLPTGKIIETIRFLPSQLDAGWVTYFESLLARGGGPVQAPCPWELLIHHQSPSTGVASLAINDTCIGTMLFLSGKDVAEERRTIYQFLTMLAACAPRSQTPTELDFQLLNIRPRPLLALVLLANIDELTGAFVLDASAFLSVAWFNLNNQLYS